MDRRTFLASMVALGASAGATAARAEAPASGRPRVVLDRLTLPAELPDAARWQKDLTKVLARLARAADWGAGAGATITYRFQLVRLEVEPTTGGIRVHAEASGELPRNKRANGALSYSGEESERAALERQVVEVVARGVITRLAEMERGRRAAG